MARRLLVLFGCVVAAMLLTIPATANNRPTTGPQINLLVPPATFPADTAFHVEHGVLCGKGAISDCTNASTHFDLDLDGVPQPSTVDVDNFKVNGDHFILKRNLTNYPDGLPAGPHTFRGTFYVNGAVFLAVGPLTITFTP